MKYKFVSRYNSMLDAIVTDVEFDEKKAQFQFYVELEQIDEKKYPDYQSRKLLEERIIKILLQVLNAEGDMEL